MQWLHHSGISISHSSTIRPLRGLAVKGFLWYQGEANTHSQKRCLRPPSLPAVREHYACTFPALVASWRQEFSAHGATSPEAPFGFVQLAPYRDNVTNSGFPSLRWHQTADTGAVPNPRLPGVFMAVSLDTRDPRPHPAYTVRGLHPRYKQVGQSDAPRPCPGGG
jgi:sialate O-acetylesterase